MENSPGDAAMSSPSLQERADLAMLEDTEAGCLREVSLAGFMQADSNALGYAFHPTVPRKLLTLWAGHGGAGKSTCAITLAAHGACGVAFAGMQPDGFIRTLYVSLEDAGDLVRYRLRRVCETYGLDPQMVESNVRVLDGSAGNAALMVEINAMGIRQLSATPLMEEVEDEAAGADLVIVDNASDAFGGNENERRGVAAFIRRLSGIARKHGAGLILLAHIDKAAARHGANGNSYSGSTAWHNSARSRLALVLQEDGTVELVHEKNNLGKCADMQRLAWNDHGVLVPHTFDPQTADDDAAKDSEAALRALYAANQLGMRVPTGTSGPATSWHKLEPLPDLAPQFRAKAGKRRLHAALLLLQKRGLICRTSFKTAQRNVRECWELTQTGEEIACETAPIYIPIPLGVTNARTGCALVGTDAATYATNATDADAYRTARDGRSPRSPPFVTPAPFARNAPPPRVEIP